MNQVAVVILNYNGRDFLHKFLPVLIQHSGSARLIVADNCSTDDSLQVISEFPEVELIRMQHNSGYAGGYNEALNQVDSNYFILLNSDVEVTENWITPLVTFLENNPAYAAAQPKILDYNRRDFFEYAGASGGYLDSLGYPYCRGRVLNNTEQDQAQYNDTKDIMWASGACFIIRSAVFHQIGGFDASFFAHMEEIDLSWRLKSAGYLITSVPSSVVYHVGGGTLSKSSSRKTYLNFRNGIQLICKNTKFSRLVWMLPLRIVIDWAAAFAFLKNEGWAHFSAVFRAHYHAISKIKSNTRQSLKSRPLLPDQREHLLVTQVFIKRRKTYSEINNTK